MNHEEIRGEDIISSVKEFVLLGFSDLPNLQGFLSGVFSIICIIILLGNILIIILTSLDPALQKPMYFFLANFSSLEFCYVSVTLPRILVSIWTQKRSISLLNCGTQVHFFLILGALNVFSWL
jgi:olfactory receptor